jgi:hypothetical protein
MVLPDPKGLSRVEQPESLLKDCQNNFVRHGLILLPAELVKPSFTYKASLSAVPKESKR